MINIAAALIITAAAAGAATPITVQGSIKAPGGSPVAGTHSLVFRIYDSAAAGTQLWTETHAAVPFSNGIYSAVLGNTAPLDDVFGAGLQRWLSVSLDAGTEFNPRQQITATAYANYANQAGSASNLDGVTSTGFALASHTHPSPIVYAGCISAAITSGNYCPINGGESSSNIVRTETPAIRNMTITQLMLSMPATGLGNYTLTLWINGTATSLSCTVVLPGFSYAVATGSVSVLQGDRLTLRMTGSTATNGISYSMLAE